MAYRELPMTDIREVLRRWQARQSVRKIARDTGIDRKTVRRYITAAEICSLPTDTELSDEQVGNAARLVQTPEPAIAQPSRQTLAQHRAQIAEWLERPRPLRLSKVHTLLERQGVQVTYSTLRRFAIAELGWRKRRPTVRVDDPPPGQEVQIDFGCVGMLHDDHTGRQRKLWALIVTLSFSRHTFVWPTFEQTTRSVCEGLEAAWRFFGAMPRVLVPDNMKAIVDKADALAPRLVPAFADYVQARGLFVDPARVRKPQDKPRVERTVQYVRDNWFAGEDFAGLDQARASAKIWCRDVAGSRIHGTTCRVPIEHYESEEKPQMLPEPRAAFDVPTWTDAKVHPDHHIQVARALYSVPTKYLRKRVRVRSDGKLVRIYLGTELIKVHPRKPPGGRATDPTDYPPGKDVYALRSVEALIERAQRLGPHVGAYAERVLDGPLPWARMRSAYALLSLCEKYGVGPVEAVCQSALAFDVVDVTRITRMLKHATRPATPELDSPKVVPLSPPRFARPLEQFQTRSTHDNGGGAS